MKIGELAERSGVAPRLLRYYEEQGLLRPGRGENGYRDYPEAAVDRVAQIRGLIDAGLPTSIIRDMLPCLDGPRALHPQSVDREMAARLRAERTRMDRRIGCLQRNRDAIDAYLEAAVVDEATRPA